jgi:PAS domain S-box-containing protein
MESGKELRVLMLEGEPAEAALTERALRKAGLVFSLKRVDKREAFVRALDEFAPMIVLVDYKLPDFDGLSAVRIVRQKHPDLPVILVTEALGDEAAVEFLRAGASDCVFKDRLTGLAPAVRRAVAAADAIAARARAEGELRQIQAVLAAAEQLAGSGSWEWDFALDRHLWSEGLYKVLGLTAEATSPTFERFLACVHPDDRDRLKVDAAAMLSGVGPKNLELRIVRPDGTERIIETRNEVFRDERGKPLRALGVIQDVTARRQAQETIREDEDQLRVLLDQSIAGIYVILDDATMGYLNRAFAQLVGYTPEEVEGRPVADFIAETDRLAVASAVQAVFAGELPSVQLALAIKRKDGSLVDALAHGAMATYRGRPAILGVIMDISERKHTQESRARLAAIVESSSDPMVSVSTSGVVLTWNSGAERQHEYSAAEMIGRNVAALAPPDRKEEVEALCKKVVSAGEVVVDYETVGVRKDGTPFDVSLTLSPIKDDMGSVVGISAAVRDISRRKQAERKLEKVTRALTALGRADALIVHARDAASLQQEICQVIRDAGDYEMVWIGRAERDENKSVRVVAQAGSHPDRIAGLGITWGDGESGRGPTGTAIRTGLPQFVQDFEHSSWPESRRRTALSAGFKGAAALPLRDESGIFGALSIVANEPSHFDQEEAKLLTELADDLSYGIMALQSRAGRVAALERLERSMEDMIGRIAATVEMRDSYTAGHEARVAEIAVAIAQGMGLPADKVHGIRLASMVHDLGKIRIPAEFLSKPGKLLPTEFEVVKGHAQAGYEILEPVEFPWPIAEVALQHHERLDGSGYPQGLKGEAIILEARIIAVADVVEAMMSHRPFRAALGLEAALAEIEKGKGTLYDPAAVDACVKAFRGNRINLD